MKLHRRLLASVLIFMLSPMSANAVPITFTFDMSAFTNNVLAGTTSVLEVTADNGGTTQLNQVFLNTQITGLSTDLTGGVNAPLYYAGSAIYITTDAEGIATLAPPVGPGTAVTSVSGDTGGSGLEFIGLRGGSDFNYYVQTSTGQGGNVTAASSQYSFTSRPSQVSEPGTLALLAVGIGFMYRRKNVGERV